MFGVASAIDTPPESIVQAYRALRNEAPRPEPIEIMLRDAISHWPENSVLKHLLADLLDARSAVAEAGITGAVGEAAATRIERLAALWPHWDAPRELLTPVATA